MAPYFLGRIVLLYLLIPRLSFCELIVQSEKLRGYQGCNDTQQRVINSAWHEAMEIAAAVRGNIDFNSDNAETDFLGRSKWNKKHQKDLKGLFVPTSRDPCQFSIVSYH